MAPVCFTEPWLPRGCHGNTPWEAALTLVWVDRVSRPIRSCQKDWRPSREPMAPRDRRGIHMLQLEPSAWRTALRDLSTGQPLCFHFTIISDASLAFLVKPFCINVTVVEVKTSWQFLITFPGIQQTHLIFISQPYWNMEVRSILTPLGWYYLIPHSNASVYWAVDVEEGVFNGSGS